MILVFLKNDECVEVTGAERAETQGAALVCYSADNSEVARFDLAQVEVFTNNPRIAELMKDEVCEDITAIRPGDTLVNRKRRAIILIVDDDPSILRLLQLEMQIEGFEVLAVPSGRGALEVMEDHSPDLAIIDIRLPDMEGTELMRMLKADTDMPVIILTALTLSDEEHEALSAEAEVIRKPFRPDDLAKSVRAHLPFYLLD